MKDIWLNIYLNSGYFCFSSLYNFNLTIIYAIIYILTISTRITMMQDVYDTQLSQLLNKYESWTWKLNSMSYNWERLSSRKFFIITFQPIGKHQRENDKLFSVPRLTFCAQKTLYQIQWQKLQEYTFYFYVNYAINFARTIR